MKTPFDTLPNTPEERALATALLGRYTAIHPFYRMQDAFSQWHPCLFSVDNQTYTSTEQWMMAEKARLFQDPEALTYILAAGHPREQKALGRSIRGFDDATWRRHRLGIVLAGNRHKFTQAPALHQALAATRGKLLVEASPVDTIWGVGLPDTYPNLAQPARWRGLNLLGFALTALREELVGE